MAVHIRLFRMGAKKRPFYRIVAADSRRARDGRFIEVLGTYNPIERPATVTIKEERVTAWLNEGAQPSHTVGSLLTQIGFIEKYEKAQTGQDVSTIEVKDKITERKKKTRKVKKAALAAAQAAEADAEAAKAAKAAEAEAAAKAAEAATSETGEDAPAEATEDTGEEKPAE